jgi:hypothetical protein
MMLYMLLICYDPTKGLGPDDPPSLQPEHAKLGEQLRQEGVYVGGAGLIPVQYGTNVRRVDGAMVTTDGPFAETREALGGYYLVDCKSRAEAVEIAKRIPVASDAWVQVRQVMVYADDPAKPKMSAPA